MKALVCIKPGKMEYADIPEPELHPGFTIIRVRRICICGTDLHAFEGNQPFFEYPRILGHELSGEIVDFDNAPGFNTGDAVTFLPYLNCGTCIACRMGKTNCCTTLQVCGVHVDGGMVDYFAVPSRLLVASQGLGLTELAMVEPMSVGAHGIRRAGIEPGEYVLIMGAGPIGLGAMEFARLRGAEIIVMDTNASRLDFCKTRLKISRTILAGDDNILEQLKDITNGDMATTVVDASGNLNAIHHGLNYLAHGGKYILIGLQKEKFSFSHPEFHKKEATLMSSRNATREDFNYVVQCMADKKIRPLEFITDHVAFSETAAGFPTWSNPSGHTIKVVVEKD